MGKKDFHKYSLLDGKLIDISNVTPEIRALDRFECPGCGKKMIACQGKIRTHYFRHSSKENCSWETYLHHVSKFIIKDRFDYTDTFEVKYNGHNICKSIEECKLRKCGKEFIITEDLKQTYDTCVVEGVHEGYRGDIKLTHSQFPDRVMFIEIAVTHKCSPEKINSGIKILEIDVVDEQPCEKNIIESPNIHFYNFPREVTTEKNLNRFFCIKHDENTYSWDVSEISCFNVQSHDDKHFLDITATQQIEEKKLLSLGIATMIDKGCKPRLCFCCYHYYNRVKQCRKPIKGRIENNRLIYYLISPKEQYTLACECSNYLANIWTSRDTIKHSPKFPVWENPKFKK